MKKQENQEVLKEALKELVARLNKAETFVLEEMPQVCQQIVARKTMSEKFDILTSSIWTGVLFIATILLILHFWIVNSLPKPEGFYHSDDNVGNLVLTSIAILGCGIGFVCQLDFLVKSKKELMMLKVSPKLYVIEKLSELIK